ncbi:MAG TPA: PilN domain-containing protein, partial [Armatimonadota bacterium]|nr:PilN domain-containing protein [Armatimonadota bacterium]
QVLCGDRLLFTRFLPFDGGNWASDLRRSVTGYSLEHPEAPIEEVVLLGEADEEQVARAVGLPVRRATAGPGVDGDGPPAEWSPLVGLARQWLGLGKYPLTIEPQGWAEAGQARGRSQTLVAALGVAALLAVVVVWQLDSQRASALETERAARLARQVERDKKMLALLRGQRETLLKQVEALGLAGDGAPGREVADTAPLELLRRSTALAPAGIWFTQMTYEQGKPLQLQGTTRSAAQVTRYLRALEQVSGFRRAELGYLRSAMVNDVPVTHFRIDCSLVGAGTGAVNVAPVGLTSPAPPVPEVVE